MHDPATQASPVTAAALENCASEPIQFAGGVQDFGCLLVVSSEWIVQNASANCADHLGLDAATIIGTRLIDHLPPDAMHTLRGKVQVMPRDDEGIRIFGVDLFGDGRLFDIALHRNGGSYLFEFETKHRPSARQDDNTLVQGLRARVRLAEDVIDKCDVAANGIWALTGFDRVMVYRFGPDFAGTVVSECLGAGADSYLGQRFPASDIPAQARALYTRNLLRIISDVDGPVHPLVPGHGTDGKPVDLSLSVTRAVSPIHLQYLRNMGVASSMSVSIICNGRLWGLITCHHPRPHHVDYETRSAVEMFVQILSYELTLTENATAEAKASDAYALHERLSMLFEGGMDFDLSLSSLLREIATVIQLDGLALTSGGLFRSEGLAPTEAEFRALLPHVARNGMGKVFSTDQIDAACPGAVSPDRGIGGLLAIPVRRDPPEYVLLLRREVTQDVVWAGRPSKHVLADGRLSPRDSFSAWREQVRGHCEAWALGELRAAEVLRVALLEMVLKQTSHTSSRDQRRSQRQELMIAELNHRLRNLFGLVTGVIGRGAGAGAADGQADGAVQQYAAELRGRIAALARANDLLTETAGNAISLRQLIADEAEAFAGDASRIAFVGGDAILRAGLRSTMALVMHELVTNAVKYGALSVPAGQVTVRFSQADEQGDVALSWVEHGGPPVTPPARSGFGSTLLERAIPHELGGTATIDFAPGGVTALFTIPATHVQRLVSASEVPDAVAGRRSRAEAADTAGPVARTDGKVGGTPTAGRLRMSGRALVVEDNLLIAMNASDALRALGVEDVAIVGSVASALARIEAEAFDLAILDLDLGGVLSTPVAAALRQKGVPFLLATGYDDGAAQEPPLFRGVARLKKPYNNDAISSALIGAGLIAQG